MSNFISADLQIALSFFFTMLSYFLARYAYLKLSKPILLQPMLIATSLLIVLISVLDLPIVSYQKGTSPLTWMIAPLSISLMIPLADNLKEIGRVLPSILFTLLVCGTFTVSITLVIAHILGASHLSLLSLSGKSVTTPVALVISQEVGGIPALTALIVIITGVIGVITAPILFKVLKIKDERALGITLGLSAHIIGSAYAMEQNLPPKKHTKNRYAAYSIVSMSLTALLSALLLPWLLSYFL